MQSLTLSNGYSVAVWQCVTGRLDTLAWCPDALATSWTGVVGCVDMAGSGGMMTGSNAAPGAVEFYSIHAREAD